MKQHRCVSIVRLIPHKRELIGDRGEAIPLHFTLTEMKAGFSAILLDLRSQLCYDSVKTCQISKGLADEKHCVV